MDDLERLVTKLTVETRRLTEESSEREQALVRRIYELEQAVELVLARLAKVERAVPWKAPPKPPKPPSPRAR